MTRFMIPRGGPCEVDHVTILMDGRTIKIKRGVEYVVREKGEWDDTGRFLFGDGSLAIRCNQCGAALHQEEWDKYNWHFCPNCGADMRKGGRTDDGQFV